MLIVLCWLGSAALGYAVGNNKGRGSEGLLLGLLLGLIGVVIVVCLKPKVELATQSPGQCWAADPYGRHELRWWNGAAWTAQVSDRGNPSVDPFGAVPSPPSMQRQF